MATHTHPVEVDHDALMAFVLRAVEEVGAGLGTALVVTGDELGLYRGLRDGGPQNSTPFNLVFEARR